MTWIKTQNGTLINAHQIGAIELVGPFIEWFASAAEMEKEEPIATGQLFCADGEDPSHLKRAAAIYGRICDMLAIGETFIDVQQIELNIKAGLI